MDKLKAEKAEINALINKGVTIEVEQVVFEKVGFFNRRKKKVKKHQFIINEPTLAILDRIADEQIEIVIDEKILSSENALNEAKKLTKAHAQRMSKILAIAVLGQDAIIHKKGGYKYNEKQISKLANLFFYNVKPSKLLQYMILINTMSNLGDFTNSIRLMSAARTTMPILIEEKRQG